jgi:hypothetical protein
MSPISMLTNRTVWQNANIGTLLKWAYQTFLAATHLINHTHTKLLDYDTLVHHLLVATPDYSSFQVFACVCWPNLRSYNSHKL